MATVARSAILVLGAAAAFAAACGDDGGATSGSSAGDGGAAPTSGNGGGGGAVTSAITGVGSSVVTVGPTTTSGSSSGSGDGGDGPGNGGEGPGNGGAGQGGASQGSGGEGTGGAPDACDDLVEIFVNDDLNACGSSYCCGEMTACSEDFTACFTDNTLDTTLPDGAAVSNCLAVHECFGPFAPWCDSGIGFTNPTPAEEQLAECLSDSCCDPLDLCTAGATGVADCLACLNGEAEDFSLCEDVDACSQDSCDEGLLFVPVCESGLGYGSIAVGTCLDENCCAAYMACTADGEDTDACLDCLQAGQGSLCDAAIACQQDLCNTAICDSGLVVDDIELAACLSTSCCTEYRSCAGDFSPGDIQLCLDCLDDGGGDLCNAAIACGNAGCDGAGGGGGAGG